jgi:hypothetical protein
MPDQPDITYSLDPDEKLACFNAHTKSGEDFMGGPEVSMPITSAGQYKQAAIDLGLTVLPFP